MLADSMVRFIQMLKGPLCIYIKQRDVAKRPYLTRQEGEWPVIFYIKYLFKKFL